MSATSGTKPSGRAMSGPAKALFRLASGAHAALYRLTGGRFGGRMRNSPVLVLTTVGRKSGKARESPLLYLADGDRLIIVASFGGATQHPAWFINLRAEPEVTVRLGKGTRRVRAEVADPEERARLWPRLVAMYPDYATYQQATTREIPVVILHPIERSGTAA